MSPRARLLDREARASARLGTPLALLIYGHERDLLVRAVHCLAERDGPSETTRNLEHMLVHAVPADVLRELELGPRCAPGPDLGTVDA